MRTMIKAVFSQTSRCNRLLRYLDAFFALCDGKWDAFRSVLDEHVTFRKGAPVKKKTYLPEIEGLEVRQMPTTVQWASTSYSFSESNFPPSSGTLTLDSSTASTSTVDVTASNITATTGSAYYLPAIYTITFHP